MHTMLKSTILATTMLAPLGAPALTQTSTTADGAVQTGTTPQGEQPTSEVIVTAQKREQRLIDVPQSVSVVSADALQQTHAERFDDFFTRVPSASVAETQAGETRLILRGINTGGVGATVATYIDETPYGSATSLADGAIFTPDLDPSDIDRVEVLRGPQGTLYGANSLGGLVKYVTVLPSTDAFHGSFEGSFENVDHGSSGGSVRGAVNVPVASSLAVRASGFYRQDPGFIDDPRHGKDVNDGQTYGGRVSALFKPGDRFTLRGTVTLQNIASNGTNERDVDPVTLQPVQGRYVQERVVDQPNNVHYRIYNATATYDFGHAELLSSTSWGNLDQRSVGDLSGALGGALTQIFGSPTPLGTTEPQYVRQRRFTEEVRLASAGGGKRFFDWTIGGFYTRERNNIHQELNGVDLATGELSSGLGDVAIVDAPSFYREYAGFANATLHLSSRFDLGFGGRYSHNSQSSEQGATGPLAALVPSATGSSKDHVFTYSVAPSFKPNDDTTIYARVARGYRPGGPNLLPANAPADVPNQFGADTTTNYEVGVKSELLDRKLSLELTAFYIDWRNIQLFTVINDVGVNINGGKARSKGIEFSVSARPVEGLSLSANGAYVDAYLTDDAPAAVGGLRGDDLPYTAKFSGTLSADYERPLSERVNATAGVSWRFTGHRQSAFDTAYGQRRLSAYDQVDAHAGVTFDRFRIDAFVRNVTDSRGVLNVGAAGSALAGSIAEAITRPRSYGLTLGVKF